VALEQLDTLRLKKLWQNGETKEYYSELTDILRMYIEQQFDIHAAEMTTDEILFNMKPIDINRKVVNKLSDILMIADLVKFAKAFPSPLDNEQVFNHSIDFVQETATYHTVHDNIDKQQTTEMQSEQSIETISLPEHDNVE
jgi:hypothetical protein